MFQLRNGNLHLAVLRILNHLELILVQKRLASANFNKLILLPFRYKLMLPRKAKCLFVGFSKGDLAIWTEGLLSQARAWPCIIDVYSRKYRIVHCSPILPPLSILYFKGTFWFTIKESIATFFFFSPHNRDKGRRMQRNCFRPQYKSHYVLYPTASSKCKYNPNSVNCESISLPTFPNH